MTYTRHLRKGLICWNCDNICPAPSRAKNWLCANDERGPLCPECNPNPKSQHRSIKDMVAKAPGSTGGPAVGMPDSTAEPWACGACTFLNHPELGACEVCETARGGRKSQTQSRRRENPIFDNNPSARDLHDKAYLISQHCGRKRPTAQDAILAALIQGRI